MQLWGADKMFIFHIDIVDIKHDIFEAVVECARFETDIEVLGKNSEGEIPDSLLGRRRRISGHEKRNQVAAKAKNENRRQQSVEINATGFHGNDFIVARHPQKGQKNRQHHRHRDYEHEKKRGGQNQNCQNGKQIDVVVDDEIGNLEHLRHQKQKREKYQRDDERCKELFKNVTVE